MTTARRFLPVFLAAAGVLVGCDSARDERARADHELREVKEEAAEAQSKLDDMKRQGDAPTQAEVDEVVDDLREAQAEAREVSAEADAALARARLEARSAVERSLQEKMKSMADLQREIREKLPKAEADRLVEELTRRSGAVQEILLEIDRARGINLEAIKRTAEQRLGDFDQALEQARQRV
ncbi:hypothetical protein [Sorangium sp. So ce1335]|uniref:hypothetical protein n=1 Tax=Sorangium sp. So ce1335 TaxID=3133335 RepID=UPI003F64370A